MVARRPQASRRPSGPLWVHEIKFDGCRTQGRIDGDDMRSLTVRHCAGSPGGASDIRMDLVQSPARWSSP
jgi:hypothetical protein